MLRRRVVLLTILGAALIAVVLLDVGAPGGCKKADHLYNGGQLSAARSAYVSDLNDSSTMACAQIGLRRVAVGQCQRAVALEGADVTDKARAAYADIATAEPVSNGSASQRSGVIGTDCAVLTPVAMCRSAWSLADAGLLVAGRQDFVALLQRDAARACGVAGLRAITAWQCKAAKALFRAGQTEDARKAFIAVATTEPATPVPTCALRGLRALPPPQK
jgi:L-fucose mutarotase/ribose pyranase (RbsD/FucU family)